MPVLHLKPSTKPPTATVLEIAVDASLPLHGNACAAFEAWLCLPDALRLPTPALPGLVVAAPDGPSGAPAVVSGFGAYLHAKMTGSALTAILLPLTVAEATQAAEGEVAALQAAMAIDRRKPPRGPAVRSLLEIALREERQE